MPISLEPHNVETYQKVTDKLKESNKVAVIHPTGTGKMYIALKLLEENKGKKAIYVAPSNPILHDVKKNIYAEGMTMSEFPKLKRITYQKLARLTDEEIQELDADVIILDEFHHCGAPEWGKGVERLLQRNEGGIVLGLSATPLRYNDGLRDMADELFANNVASEMTLEEAIESEILPEASYVSTLYGYYKELEDMQTNIDKIKDDDKRKEAQDLLNNLREKLDANTQNLPELFSQYMQNKSGKYIVFCRNIEDMNEKMEQAQKMFGGVNSNITIRGVSSKIKESDKILTEFEQDSEEGTLKLLYAVDMLNEGYHIKDLDGVVMMRPTFSPTIYTQQLGRALTVGGDKSPVVLDLVNNFDSCKIIADFAERMRQYKGNKGTRRTEQDKKSRLSIFDKTKEFREIAEKITELSKRSRVTLEQKIEIFERFMQTGEELDVNTTFEGYPIGQWAITIRSSVNRMNDGKDNRGKINPTEEQLEKLESMGILERQFDSTIDEKIDSLVEWRRKYPKAKIVPIALERDLKQYAKTEDELKKIQDEYKRMKRYYSYLRVRKSQGKLNEEQISKCKEGNIGGIFGYPTKTKELAEKYGVTEEYIDKIITEYESIDNLYEMYRQGTISTYSDMMLVREIIKDIIDINDNPNRGYDNLYRAAFKKEKYIEETGMDFYSSEELKKAIEKLNERERQVINRIFGLVEGTMPRTFRSVSEELGVAKYRAVQIANNVYEKLRHPRNSRKIMVRFEGITANDAYMTEEEKRQIYETEKDLQLQNGDVKEKIAFLKSMEEKLNKRGQEERLKSAIYEFRVPTARYKEITYTELGRMGIDSNTIDDFMRYYKNQIVNEGIPFELLDDSTYEYLIGIGIDEELANKIILEAQEKRVQNMGIDELELSGRSYNCLNRAGIKTLGQLRNMSPEELMGLRNLGKKSYAEIIDKMNAKGYYFLPKTDFELSQEENDIMENPNDDPTKKEVVNRINELLDRINELDEEQLQADEELKKVIKAEKEAIIGEKEATARKQEIKARQKEIKENQNFMQEELRKFLEL